jgi:glutathione S-transferase
MILIGQFDSPFVRRVGIALRLYDLPFEHRPWSTFGDADKIAPYNPLRRVPTLVLDDGEVLIESTAILDHLDETARTIPRGRPGRVSSIAETAGVMGLRRARQSSTSITAFRPRSSRPLRP